MTRPLNPLVNYRSVVAASDVPIGRQGRAIRWNGATYAATSQAATDALDPIATGGVLIAEADTGAPLSIVGIHSAGAEVEVIAGAGGVAVGDLLRPEYSANAANVDRFVSISEAALPATEGVYYTWLVALTAGAAGAPVLAAVERNIHVVTEES
jgi:hypothetical protein